MIGNSFFLKSVLTFLVVLALAYGADQRGSAIARYEQVLSIDAAMSDLEQKAIAVVEQRLQSRAALREAISAYRGATGASDRRTQFDRFSQKIDSEYFPTLDASDVRERRIIDDFNGLLNRRVLLTEQYENAREQYDSGMPAWAKKVAFLPPSVTN